MRGVLNLGVAEGAALRQGLDLAVESVDESADDLDVLLRHRLLRQPGGFEGLLTSLVQVSRASFTVRSV